MDTSCLEGARLFDERGPLPPSLRVPPAVGAAVGLSVALGAAVGIASGKGPLRLLRATFFGSGFAYMTISVVDFLLHYQLEKEASGTYLGSTVVPRGESINHALTMATVISALALGRPQRRPAALRDLFVLAAPAIHLALGWRDELCYHRRRATHREDLVHTVAHLAGGVMMWSFSMMRLVDRGDN